MLRQLWRLLVDFIVGSFRVIATSLRENKKGFLISLAILFIGLGVFMGIVLKLTASPQFCGSCHNMQSYIDSWENSTHKEVGCMDCHFEPGVWGSLVGKWKAQAHIVMKITGTAPTRPHTQLSDASCLREGCHSKPKLAENEVVYKGVRFNHGTHISDLRRGKQLKCTTCHSQIVQGQHLSVTESTCFACHFYDREDKAQLAECQLCHTQTKAKIYVDANPNLPFVHKEYTDRGVLCGQCHFDVIFGDGSLQDNTCVQCHSEPEIVMSERNSEEMHRYHVTEHKVECYRCHSVIEHGIVRPDSPHLGLHETTLAPGSTGSVPGYHYDANCVKCHSFDQHESIRLMYMGTGAENVPDVPSPMYQAHADCGSCHIYLTKSTTGETQSILRLSYDKVIKSCSDCHGEGYDDMAKHWKKLLNGELAKTEQALIGARQKVSATNNGDRVDDASNLLDTAEKNLTFVRNGMGLHNMDYALKVLADSQELGEKAKLLINPQYAMIPVDSPNGCTQLCHSCVECIETTPVPFGNVQFPHDVHVQDEGLDCNECHTPREQHGQTLLQNCNDCHHGSGAGAVECQDCHVENHNLYNGQNACDEENCDVRGEKNPMAEDIECEDCHTAVADGGDKDIDSIKQTCVDCHDDSYAPMVDGYITEAEALNVEEMTQLLHETQLMVLRAIKEGKYTYDAQDLLNKAEKNLQLVQVGNAAHNIVFSKDLLSRVEKLILQARETLQTYSTVQTLDPTEYK